MNSSKSVLSLTLGNIVIVTNLFRGCFRESSFLNFGEEPSITNYGL